MKFFVYFLYRQKCHKKIKFMYCKFPSLDLNFNKTHYNERMDKKSMKREIKLKINF